LKSIWGKKSEAVQVKVGYDFFLEDFVFILKKFSLPPPNIVKVCFSRSTAKSGIIAPSSFYHRTSDLASCFSFMFILLNLKIIINQKIIK